MTLRDLHASTQIFIEWLAHDGNPPMAMMPTTKRSPFGSYGRGPSYVFGRREPRPVTDTETLAEWWDEYRQSLSKEWSRSAHNKHKAQTHTQFLAECLSSIGVRGGTVRERVARAIAVRPDLYAIHEESKAA